MKRVLVLGATGFVGGHALDAMAGHEALEVSAACRDPQRLPERFSGEARIGDLRDKAYLAGVFDGIDVVCNAFAWTSLYGHAKESGAMFLEPSLALIRAAETAGVSRFINISTTSAAAPHASADAMHPGIPRAYWPHLCNVIRIENTLRERASNHFQVANLRLGLFAGERYAIGLLPILVPRLKTHLVPWVAGGKTHMPIIDGRDIGQACWRAVTADIEPAYVSLNIVGPKVPTVREVLDYLHHKGHPRPHFSVPFGLAFVFAWMMERLDPIVPWEPLVTRSIIHLLRDTHADNGQARIAIGYQPVDHWRDAVDAQLAEMTVRQVRPMSMAKAA